MKTEEKKKMADPGKWSLALWETVKGKLRLENWFAL